MPSKTPHHLLLLLLLLLLTCRFSSLQTAVRSRDYNQIPQLLTSPNPNPNPFLFLSALPPPLAAATIADLLRSLAALRPRSAPTAAYSALLSLTLPPDHPSPPLFLPAALAVLRLALRSGPPPPPSARRSLPAHWVALRRRATVAGILSSLAPLGLQPPDLNTLHYLISALCAAGAADEAVSVLRAMPAVGVAPDSWCYCEVIEGIAATSAAAAERMLRELVVERGMAPRKGTVARVVTAMRAAGEARRAAELVRFVESEGWPVGFEGYEAAAEGCLESGDVVAAARVVVEMAGKGLVPCIGVRRRVVEGLAAVGQFELASDVRRRLSDIGLG